MQRRNINPGNGGAAAGYGGGYSQGAGYGQQASSGGYAGYGGGGSSYSHDSGGGGGSYSGYGSSSGGGYSGGGGGGGFGVASGGGYSDASYSSASSPSSKLKGKKKKTGSGMNPMSILLQYKFVVVCIVSLLLLVVTLYYRSQYNAVLEKFHVHTIMDAVKSYEKLSTEKKKFEREASTRNDQTKSFKDTIRTLEKQNRELRKTTEDLKVKAADGAGMGLEEVEKLQGREEAWAKQVTLLQNATQRESKRAVMERFGAGPHHVLFTVQLPNDPNKSTFRVELAPLEAMPHANHLFLQQVYHELWDNTWFYLNGPHVLQAGPQDWDEENAGQSLKRFTDTQLDTLSFPEYSHDFPHVPWTMGFTGRPGGPDWYINKVDNTKPHGPGGQFQHDLSEQADSCFAKIIEGQDTLDRIFQGEIYPRNSEYAFFFTEPVEIVSARIQEPVQEGVVTNKPNKLPKGSAANVQQQRMPKKPQRVAVNQEAKDTNKSNKAAATANSGAAKVAAARAASVKAATMNAANNKNKLDIEKMKQQAAQAAGGGAAASFNKATPGDNNPPSP